MANQRFATCLRIRAPEALAEAVVCAADKKMTTVL
jgi:hypothetical protein